MYPVCMVRQYQEIPEDKNKKNVKQCRPEDDPWGMQNKSTENPNGGCSCANVVCLLNQVLSRVHVWRKCSEQLLAWVETWGVESDCTIHCLAGNSGHHRNPVENTYCHDHSRGPGAVAKDMIELMTLVDQLGPGNNCSCYQAVDRKEFQGIGHC
jgi:hypothetical protein